MATQFSYDVLKSIIGHLTLEKRFQIAKFCPALITAEQKCPLHLELLQLNHWFFRVDDLIFGVGHESLSDEERTDPATRVRIYREKLKNMIFEQFLPKKSEELWKKYLDLCLADRGTVKVRLINCDNGMDLISKFPKGLKMECHELKLEHRQLETIRAIHPFLTTPFPEEVSLSFDSVEDLLLEEELVKQAKILVIRKKYAWTDGQVGQLTKLRNEKIHVESRNAEFPPKHLMKVAESWLASCPDAGTRFIVEINKFGYLLNVMDFLKNNLGAVQRELLREDVRTSALQHYITIQMRSGDELNIFGGRNDGKNWREARYILEMEIMEKGSSL